MIDKRIGLYIFFIHMVFFTIVALENSFFYWKIYLLALLSLVIIYFIYKIKRLNEIKVKEKKVVEEKGQIKKDTEVRSGDLVEIVGTKTEDFLSSGRSFPQGVVSAINAGMASVQVKGEIKMVEVKKLKKIKHTNLKFKQLFFLGGDLLEQLQTFNIAAKEETKRELYKKLIECVDFFKNGDFSDEYNETRSGFSEYSNMEKYFGDLKKLIDKAGMSLHSLGYESFEIDLAIGLLFDSEGQKNLINSVDASKLVKNYLEINAN